jgi:hypothetical protein
MWIPDEPGYEQMKLLNEELEVYEEARTSAFDLAVDTQPVFQVGQMNAELLSKSPKII